MDAPKGQSLHPTPMLQAGPASLKGVPFRAYGGWGGGGR
jgi:hypothetical protein